MTILTANDFAAQMVAQLRVLEPSISAEVGTPERKIIDTVAQALADNQVDLSGLGAATDINSKYGSVLDQFTALFGFARQSATSASGYVVFSRNTPAPAAINIPVGATVQSNTSTSQGLFMQYTATAGGSIPQGDTDSTPILVTCTSSGMIGNANANTLTQIIGTPLVQGVTSVTNPAPITGGLNLESDDAYKVRFQNTIFRTLAGTVDQYLAIALSTAFSTKANVVGPISKYQEYIQVPDVDDAGFLNGTSYANNSILPSGVVIPVAGTGGVQNQWTSSVSSIPYAKDIYIDPPPFLSNGQVSAGQYFFRLGTDFEFNYPPTILGDAYRENESSTSVAPNFTFLNIFNPSSGVADANLQSAAPGQVLLAEYSYLSGASRNSISHNVQNAVDVYVDGANPTQASTVTLSGYGIFTTTFTDALYVENFRRDGQPTKRPIPGNFFTALYQEPLVSLPLSVTIGTNIYYLGVHYWLVHEIDSIGGSIRARDGIEWSAFLNADPGGFPYPTGALYPIDAVGDTIAYNPLAPYTPGAGSPPPLPGTVTLSSYPAQTQIEVDNFEYDGNIVTLQAAMEGARQITTDVLVHQARTRYFKFDVTVMYTPQANFAVSNAAASTSLQAYMNNQFFGSVIQLSDVLDVIHQTSGIDNVRWSNDLPSVPTKIRAIECDAFGDPLHVPTIDRVFAGSTTTVETQRLYVAGGTSSYEVASLSTVGTITGGTFKILLTWNGDTYTTGSIAPTATAATIATAVQAAVDANGVPLPSSVVVGSLGPLGTSNVVLTFQGAMVGPITWAIASSLTGAGSVQVVRSSPGTLAGGVGWGPSDFFQLNWTDVGNSVNFTSNPITFNNMTSATVQAAIRAGTGYPGSGMYHNITVSQDNWQTNPLYPIVSFLLTYSANGTPYLPAVSAINVTQSPYDYDADFFLRDAELPSLPLAALSTDSAIGIIVRPRAQNTFVRPGIG
jgi:hypothetical protein